MEGKHPTLYVCGATAQTNRVAGLFAGTSMRPQILGDNLGQASTLELAHSSFRKVSRVLAAVAYGAADNTYGVADRLLGIAARRTGSYLPRPRYNPRTAARARCWRPELEDAANLLAEAGLHDSPMRDAAAVLGRWEAFRDNTAEVTEALDAPRLGMAGS